MRGFTTRFNVKAKARWQALVAGAKGGEGTIVHVTKFSGAEDKPHAIWFEKGSPGVVLEIVKHLCAGCGPLVVLPDSGDVPVVVTAEAVVKKLLAEWE